jgi:hypothetical protein
VSGDDFSIDDLRKPLQTKFGQDVDPYPLAAIGITRGTFAAAVQSLRDCQAGNPAASASLVVDQPEHGHRTGIVVGGPGADAVALGDRHRRPRCAG